MTTRTDWEEEFRSRLASALGREFVLRGALKKIIEANDEFRAQLPRGWDGDPLNDACQAARPLLNNGETGDAK